MSKTKRHGQESLTDFDKTIFAEKIIKKFSYEYKRQYIPSNKLSKIYSQHGIRERRMEYNGHHPQANNHIDKSGRLRAKLKEEFRQELNNL